MEIHYPDNMDTLFKNASVFEECYEPEFFRYRDAELTKLAINVHPVLLNAAPFHTLLQGLPGTGKTTTACIVLNHLNTKTNNCFPVYIDCKVEKTPTAILKAIITSITQSQLPDAGIPIYALCKKLGNLLSKRNKILVVCLDDINLLLNNKRVNDTISLLLRLHHEHPGIHVGIIVVVSDIDYEIEDAFDAITRSAFQPGKISFPPYTKDQITYILSERAKAALHPEVISNNLLQDIATAAFIDSDLRTGIHLIFPPTHNEVGGTTPRS